MKRSLPCRSIFKSPVIRSDGSLTVCNYDLTLDLKLGNALDENVFSLWEDEKVQKLRRSHILQKNIPQKCKDCSPDHFLSIEESINYMKKNEMKDEILDFIIKNMQIPKILLINPLVSPKAPYKTAVTLGLGCIASVINPFFYVEIINMNYSDVDNYELAKYIKDNEFNIAGVTAMTYQVEGALNLCDIIKEVNPACITVMGGVFATMNPEYVLKRGCIDLVVYGEGEYTFLELMKKFEKNQYDLSEVKGIIYLKENRLVINPERPFMDADEIPVINRKLLPTFGFIFDDSTFGDLPEEQTAAVVMFSRGCPSNCIFCESPHMWKKKVRLMSIDRIMEEICYIIDEYGIHNFIIDDDSFTVFRDKVEEFCNTIISKKIDIKWRCNTKVNLVSEDLFVKMKKAGCLKVTYGVEAGNPEVLKNLKKSFTIEQVRKALELNRKTDLPGSMLMIIGSPGENPDTVKDSIKLIEELNPSGGWDFQIMQPHPGTTLRNNIKEYGGTILTDDWNEYFSDNITYIPEGFKEDEFLYWCRKVTKRPVKIAGKEYVSFSKEKNNIIEIPVDMWESGMFDRLEPFYWAGEKDFKKGYTHVLGSDNGYIKYNFELKNIPKELKIIFYGCSQNLEKGSLINILINDVLISDVTIGPKDAYGFKYEIIAGNHRLKQLRLKSGINTLTFNIKKGNMDNGLSLMYKALENDLKEQRKGIKIYYEV